MLLTRSDNFSHYGVDLLGWQIANRHGLAHVIATDSKTVPSTSPSPQAAHIRCCSIADTD
jgi:hypothetical protein